MSDQQEEYALSADGVGRLLEETRAFVSDTIKPDVIELVEPETGAKVLAVFSAHGVSPLASGFFDEARDAPRYRRGTAAMTKLDSFIDHVNRFGDTDTVVFADDRRDSPKLTAVLDYNRADLPGEHGDYRHGRHRTTFAFPLSDEWKAWVKGNGAVMSMGTFATFLEDRIGDIALAGDDWPEHLERFVDVNGGPERVADYASLVELSRGLKVYESAQVEEAMNLSSGEGHIRFSVEHETRTRTGGTIKVPTMFFISIPIFAKGAFYRIAARLRYRKTPEGVKFWYDLWRPDLSFDHAFAEAVEKVDGATEATILYGAPES